MFIHKTPNEQVGEFWLLLLFPFPSPLSLFPLLISPSGPTVFANLKSWGNGIKETIQEKH